jgi:hypothetical protein
MPVVKLSAHQHLGNRRSSVFSETRMNDFPVLQSGNQQSRVSFVHSEQRSVGEDVPKDSSPRQRVVTFTSPHTLRRSSAQTARLGTFGEHPCVHLSRPRCSGPNGIESLQSQRRICRPEPPMVTPRTHKVLHRASVTSAVPARLALFYCGGKRWQPTHEDLLKLRAGWDAHEPGRRCAWGSDMNAQGSYWISACDRPLKQMYDSGKGPILYGCGRW